MKNLNCNSPISSQQPSRRARTKPPIPVGSLPACILAAILSTSCGSVDESVFRFDENLDDAISSTAADPIPVVEGFRFDFDSPAEEKWAPVNGIRRMEIGGGSLIIDAAPGGFVATPASVTFDAEEIEQVVIGMKVNRGKLFGISWGPEADQSTAIAIQNPGEYYIYPIKTARLPHWEGRIHWLTILPSNHPEGAIAEIDFVELVPTNSFPDSPVGKSEHWVGSERRNVLYVHSPSELVFEKTVPDRGRMDLGAAIVSRKAPTDFTVAVRSREETVVFAEVLSRDDRWLDVSVDLADWAGERVEIVLRTDSPFEGSAALWSNPVLYQVERDRKNVVVYLIDALRSDHLSCYGYDRNTSPEIDQFAAGGIRFVNSYSHAARTLESIPTLMSSTYTSTHKVKKHTSQLDESFVTMAEAMREAGYATAAFITNVNAGVQNNNDQGFEFFYDQGPALTGERGLRTLPEEEVLRWLDLQEHRPFFAYIHTSEPHAPYEPPAPWNTVYDPEYDGQMTGVRTGPNGLLQATDPRDIVHARALYDGEISFADFQFGRFLDALRRKGMLEETMIIVISDHGEELHDHGGWNHGRTLYEELVRVPIILGGDERIPAGVVSKSYAGLVDIMPTVLGWTHARIPESAEGMNLLSIVESGGDAEARAIYAENYYPDHEIISLVEDGKKVIYNITPRASGEVEFYDLTVERVKHRTSPMPGSRSRCWQS